MNKQSICTSIGAIGSAIAAAFGGWDYALSLLIGAMAIDYVTGLIVAGVFHASTKTDTGTLESRAGWKGLCRKGMTLVIVFIACRIDLMLGVSYIRDAVCIAYIVNEVISITENAGLMGVPVPQPILNAIDVLKKKGDNNE